MKDLSKSVQIAQIWIRDLDPYFLAQRKKQEGLTKSVQIVRLGVLGSELLSKIHKQVRGGQSDADLPSTHEN